MATAVEGPSPRSGTKTRGAGRTFHLYAAGLLLAALALMIPDLVGNARASISTLLPWIAAVAASNLFPIRTSRRVHLTLDMPILLAAGFVMGWSAAGLVALLATIDREELASRDHLWTGVANRAQTALTVMAASAVFMLLGGEDWHWPAVGGVAFVAVATDVVVNYVLVACGFAIRWRTDPLRAIGELALGSAGSFAFVYAAFGLLSVMVALLVRGVGSLAVVLVVAPLILAHQSFGGRAKLQEVEGRLADQDRALRAVTQRMGEERRDERLAVAGELHDEVLPPLFKVHLMGQVVKQDLASGRLLDLDEDVPELLSATEAAQSAVREVVSDLRRSPLGAAGLNTTLRLLADQLLAASGPHYELSLAQADWPRTTQLLIYQVAREAMNNAARHARASVVRVETREADGRARVIVEDDGVGFVEPAVAPVDHFGLQLVRERVLAAGGDIAIDSAVGEGTRVAASIPLDR